MLEYAKQLWNENPDHPQVQVAVRKLSKADLVRFTHWLLAQGGTTFKGTPLTLDKLVAHLS